MAHGVWPSLAFIIYHIISMISEIKSEASYVK